MDLAGSSSSNATPSAVTINDLPKEILQKLFSYLDCQDLISVSMVCSEWKGAVGYEGLWGDMQWTIKENVEPGEIEAILEFIPSVRSIKFEMSCAKYFHCKTILKKIASLCNVILSLDSGERNDIDSKDLKSIIREFPNIEGLKLRYLKTDDWYILKTLQTCLNLKILEFNSLYCPWIRLYPITIACPELTHLQIGMPHGIDFAVFLTAKKEKIQSLVFRAPPDNAYAIPLGACKNLKHVSCTFSMHAPPTNEVLNAIASLSKLTQLELVFKDCMPSSSLSNFFYNMSSSNVVQLSLEVCWKMSDEEVTAILMCCPLIKRIRLNHYEDPLSDETPPYIRLFQLPHLEDIELFEFTYSQTWFPKLLKCQKLRQLILKGCFLFENHHALLLLRHLKLLYLDLSACRYLNDSFLDNFPSSVSLRQLDILGNGFSEHSVEQLKQRHPLIVINWS